MEFKAHRLSQQCKFAERIKYACNVKKPNDLGLDWLYSVPCGQQGKKEGLCQSWIFLKVLEEISCDGPKKKEWITAYLDALEWASVSNAGNTRFICPKCVQLQLTLITS